MADVIARIWRGKAASATAEAYVRHLETEVFPELRRLDGFRDAHVLQREETGGVAFVVVTLWESRDAIHLFAGEDIGRAVVAPEARALLIKWQTTVEHYDVVTS